jgi:hypothetical protein
MNLIFFLLFQIPAFRKKKLFQTIWSDSPDLILVHQPDHNDHFGILPARDNMTLDEMDSALSQLVVTDPETEALLDLSFEEEKKLFLELSLRYVHESIRGLELVIRSLIDLVYESENYLCTSLHYQAFYMIQVFVRAETQAEFQDALLHIAVSFTGSAGALLIEAIDTFMATMEATDPLSDDCWWLVGFINQAVENRPTLSQYAAHVLEVELEAVEEGCKVFAFSEDIQDFVEGAIKRKRNDSLDIHFDLGSESENVPLNFIRSCTAAAKK